MDYRLCSLVALFMLLGAFAAAATGASWPVPYNHSKARPPIDPRCRRPTGQPFCPNGLTTSPDFDPNDIIDIFVLTKTVANFENTPLKEYKQTKMALSFRSRMTPRTYSVTYQPLSNVIDGTIPYPFGKKELLWCNQAAVCLAPAPKASDWDSAIPVGSIGGDDIDSFFIWAMYTNHSSPFYQTFTVAGPQNGQVWMLPFDDVNFIVGALHLLNKTGAKLARNVSLPLSMLKLNCDPPVRLGTPAVLAVKQPKLFGEISTFFSYLQPTKSSFHLHMHQFFFWWDVHMEHKFYYLFNGAVWRLKMRSPYIENLLIMFDLL